MHTGFCWESQNERDHDEGLDVGGRIILNWIIEKENGVVWPGFSWVRIGARGGAFVSTEMNLRVPYNIWKFLSI
jgi:hypothetical protein